MGDGGEGGIAPLARSTHPLASHEGVARLAWGGRASPLSSPPTPGSDRLLVRGKYQPKYIESLLRKYIQEFVICAMCR